MGNAGQNQGAKTPTENQKEKPSGNWKVLERLQKGGSSSKQSYKVVYGLYSLLIYACMNITLNHMDITHNCTERL